MWGRTSADRTAAPADTLCTEPAAGPVHDAGNTIDTAAVYGHGHSEQNLALADALRPIAERHNVSVSAVAVAWALAVPGITGAIVGARRPDQVDGGSPPPPSR